MEPATLESAQKLPGTAAVEDILSFMRLGNHESKMRGAGHLYRNEYLEYEGRSEAGREFCLLYNEKSIIPYAEKSILS